MVYGMNRFQNWRNLAAFGFAVIVTGCNEPEIQTYRVAKEEKPSIPGGPSMPHLHWDLPTGWVEQQPDRLRVGSFAITGENGQAAQVAIIPLPGISEGSRDIEIESLNLWRKEELGLEPVTAETFESQGETVQVGDTQGKLYDLVSQDVRPGKQSRSRIVGVMARRNGILWFVKMAGDDELVAAQKPAFIQFLKSVDFHEGSHGPAAAPAAPVSTNTEKVPAEAGLPNWQAPEGWQERAPGPMLTAAWTATGENGAQADVTVSKLSGDGGGLVANVNRWRGQLGLQPASESEITSAVEWQEIGSGRSYLVDLKGTNVRSGQPARMLAVGVPTENETWFYKFMGDDAVIEKERARFIQFIQSAH